MARHPLAMASGIMPDATPVDLVECAAVAGFDYGGMWIEPADWSDATTRAVKAALAATGLPLLDVEVVWIKPGPADPAHDRIVDIGMELGARNLLCVSSDPDAAATVAKLARLSERAGSAIRVNLEFGLFTEVKTIDQASAMVAEVDHPAMGLLIDALHWTRSGGTLAQVAAVPPQWLNYVQLCDAPAPGADPVDPGAILTEAIDGRMPLGEGGLPLGPLLAAMPAGLPIAVEERSKALRESWPDLRERATRLYATSRQWLDQWSEGQAAPAHSRR
ncbi:sugar phosphate isomerase/epimerase [Sphingobium fontiphilum]|uniref:Sugar phosphate isomerase/epimerase n=1 Tax=Sphingobium fontiphilum TaxID=944425 RepID=A0A7W6DD96_9SPHN|nr:TIM barrel protein [Sphingobium fontiphilum]MBB3981053.1 sugar phosphate isomerase/epimerase [Sphingobium fontiphilum]